VASTYGWVKIVIFSMVNQAHPSYSNSIGNGIGIGMVWYGIGIGIGMVLVWYGIGIGIGIGMVLVCI
jgi:hypothetical protein